MPLQLYNTLQRATKNFEPASTRETTLYSCGPTVYNHVHIGNLRSFIIADTLYRTLVFNNYSVKWVMNITDIDDKTIVGTIKKYGPNATVNDLQEYTSFYLDTFKADLEEINIPHGQIFFKKITDIIPQIQNFILKLIEKGYAYQAEDGSAYFNIQKYQTDFGDYGQLTGDKFLEGKKVGARVKVDEYEKDNLSDFALWKAHTPNDANIYWDHPTLGKGRPGWHIECSVVNNVEFGNNTTDIHTGGVDLIFPHHTNEIAQSQVVYKPFVNYWVHSEHLLVDGKKMSKSLGNFHTLKDILAKGFSPLDFRYFLLSANYRSQQNFSFAALEAAQTGLRNFYQSAWQLKNLTGQDKAINQEKIQEFTSIINNDLNLPEALGKIHGYIKDPTHFNFATLLEFDKVLGLKIAKNVEACEEKNRGIVSQELPLEIQTLAQARDQARAAKNWAKSDELRRAIETAGYTLKDHPNGTSTLTRQ